MIGGHPLLGQSPSSCAADSVFQLLDFWLGSWNVFVGDTLVGTNRVEKILDGCAIHEDWRQPDGWDGQSLFYVDPRTKQWKQVWVTTRALDRGGLKEKVLIGRPGGTSTRFQGQMFLPDGRSLLDRTTLTPLPNGDVRQVIEISGDGGDTWRTTFDARYRRMP
jgi:hypothetical protein